MANNKIELIRQALGAAESSIKLAKQLLSEVERGSNRGGGGGSGPKKERDGIVGTFDGEQMATEAGDKYPVPVNYASKSMLIAGDKLKLVEEAGEKRFKQIEHVKRHRTTGILAKKDGKWKAVTPEGSYKVLPEAVTHFGGDVGDEVVLHLPAANLSTSYGAIESVTKKVSEETPSEPESVAEPKSEQKEQKLEQVKAPSKKEEPQKEEKPAKEKPLKPPEPKKEETVKVVAPKATSSEDELT